jgi:hypothetical protein
MFDDEILIVFVKHINKIEEIICEKNQAVGFGKS